MVLPVHSISSAMAYCRELILGKEERPAVSAPSEAKPEAEEKEETPEQ